MLITTTPIIQGHEILEYKQIVFGEVISGVDVISDIAGSFRDFFGGRSNTYEGELVGARDAAMKEMEAEALKIGANAIVGVDVDYEVLGANNGMMMVSVSGTAVIAEGL